MAEVQAPLKDMSELSLGNEQKEKDALIARLDDLLERYLNTLDEYQKARELLSKKLSSVSLNKSIISIS